MFDLYEIVAIIGILIGMCILAFVLAWGLGSWECHAYEKGSGKRTEYEFPAGCFVEYQGEKMLWEEYKYRFVAKEMEE